MISAQEKFQHQGLSAASFSAIARSVMISAELKKAQTEVAKGFSAIARSVMISAYSVPGLVDHF